MFVWPKYMNKERKFQLLGFNVLQTLEEAIYHDPYHVFIIFNVSCVFSHFFFFSIYFFINGLPGVFGSCMEFRIQIRSPKHSEKGKDARDPTEKFELIITILKYSLKSNKKIITILKYSLKSNKKIARSSLPNVATKG